MRSGRFPADPVSRHFAGIVLPCGDRVLFREARPYIDDGLWRKALRSVAPRSWSADPCAPPNYLARLWATYSFLHGDQFGRFFADVARSRRPALMVPGILTDDFVLVSSCGFVCSGECLFAHRYMPLRGAANDA